MMIRRELLGWDTPSLPRAVDYLLDRYGGHGSLDLGGVTIAVPGGRAGRRLEEILIAQAEARRVAWIPPTILTVGHLPEEFYEATKPFADDLVQQLAWVQALKEVELTALARLIPSLPEADDLTGWLALGRMLARLHRELAAENLNFRQVAEKGVDIRAFREADRWVALSEIQTRYLATLDRQGLWDIQSARLFAIDHRECHTDRDIVLLGTVDLNVAIREMLKQVAPRVTSLVFAPPTMADRFDPWGCLVPEAWIDVPLDIPDEQITVADGPTDQAEAVVDWLARLDGRYAAEAITIGVPDTRLVPYVRQQLEQCEVPVRYGVGVPMAQSSVARLASSLADYLETRSYTAFASLLRHPAIDDWLARQEIEGDWLTALDEHHTWHLPVRIDGDWLKASRPGPLLSEVFGHVDRLTAPLATGDASPGDWAEPILELLIELFGARPLVPDSDDDRDVLNTCEAFHEALEGLRGIPADLTPRVSGAQAIRLVLRAIESQTIAARPDQGAIELLGWLELPLDDAPALCVTQMNEGFVPSSLNADLFLPNQLRRALAIQDNDRLLVRDVYFLSLLAASRGDLHLITGRRSGDGDPLTPSRLLLSGSEEALAKRALRFFEERHERPGFVSPGQLRPGQARTRLDVPRPRRLGERVRSMRVTEFRDYLACPYRYYLRYALRLESLVDSADELDGRLFGSLAHDVLQRFGADEVRSSTDADMIERFLNQTLDWQVRDTFGARPLAAVAVQVEQLRLRLARFAQWQADWAAQGWEIEHVEIDPPDEAAFLDVDGERMYLRGRIDRIDVHGQTGRRMVVDYKTSDAAKTPEQVHRRRQEWVDLQLPLYRHLLPTLGIEGEVDLAFLVLPKDVGRTGLMVAAWEDEDYADADETARDVVRKIWDEAFWPPASPPPAFAEEFAAVCQDQRIGAAVADADEEGDA